MAGSLSKPRLLTADRGHLLRVLSGFSGKPAGQWLTANHPARSGELKRDWRYINQLPPARLIEAVAASAPNHCIDGWSYASRAIAALVAGDHHSCRHLAYYAQLRAGLSILANLGVGIFNRINFVVDAAGHINRLDPVVQGNQDQLGAGTHEIVWDTLKEWALEPVTARIFLDLVRIRGVKLSECVEAVWPGVSIPAVAVSLIESWGLDLRRGKEEHVARNISSYVPHLLNALPSSALDNLNFVSDSWRLFEPTGASSFDYLDRYLLRSILWRQHRTVAANNDYKTGAIFARYEELPAQIRSLVSKNFLVGIEETSNPSLIRKAKSKANPAGPIDMLARALLLLRAATAFTQSSFIDAGLQGVGGNLGPWLDELAIARGFWAPASPPLSPIDLWIDVADALDDLDAAIINSTENCLSDWLGRQGMSLPTICQAERVGVWSLSI